VPSELTLSERTEASDLEASRKGDGEAYARVVKSHQTQVARRMRLFAREPAVIEELVQEVFVNAYFSLNGFRGEGVFDAWLARIATRVGYRYWKRSRRRRDEVNRDGDWWQALAEQRIHDLDPTAAGRLVHDVLGRLPPRDRLVLLLLYVEGRSTAEAARLAGWSRTMIKVQAYRARRKLRALFADLGIDSVPTAIEAAEKVSHERT
jgi:RNA polymerase sigma-70 factor (ECF subfamily)